MSDMLPHSRDDLRELHLLTDCPECGNGKICSPALCSRLNPHRSELRVMLLRSLRATERKTAEVVVLAEHRPLVRKAWSV